MNPAYLKTSSTIRLELVELEGLVDRVQRAWRRFSTEGDELFLDSVALNLHGVYQGIEKIFERIAVSTGEGIPESGFWHRALLVQMGAQVPHVRPAVLSESSLDTLDDLLGFRHVARNVYSSKLRPTDIGALVTQLVAVFPTIKRELEAFAAFLKQEGHNSETSEGSTS